MLKIVVVAEPVCLKMELADAQRGSPEETGYSDLVAEGAVGARNTGRVHLHPISIEQRRELIEGDLRRATTRNNIEIGERQAGLDGLRPTGCSSCA